MRRIGKGEDAIKRLDQENATEPLELAIKEQ